MKLQNDFRRYDSEFSRSCFCLVNSSDSRKPESHVPSLGSVRSIAFLSCLSDRLCTFQKVAVPSDARHGEVVLLNATKSFPTFRANLLPQSKRQWPGSFLSGPLAPEAHLAHSTTAVRCLLQGHEDPGLLQL